MNYLLLLDRANAAGLMVATPSVAAKRIALLVDLFLFYLLAKKDEKLFIWRTKAEDPVP